MSIYVEILVRAAMDALWSHTQIPGLHERWDLRFSRIESRRARRFDAYMVYSDSRRRIVDYLGSHEHLAVDIDLSVDEAGGLRLRSGAQRFYEGVIGFSFPMLFSGIADVREWYDDAAGCFRIVVDVHNSVGDRCSATAAASMSSAAGGGISQSHPPEAPGTAGLASNPVPTSQGVDLPQPRQKLVQLRRIRAFVPSSNRAYNQLA
jgi:hypothetical protein